MADKEKKDRVEMVRSILLQLLQDPEVLATCRGFYQEMQKTKAAVEISAAEIPVQAKTQELMGSSEQVMQIEAQESEAENKLKEKNAELEKKLTASEKAQKALQEQLQVLHQNLEQKLRKTKQDLQASQQQCESFERKNNILQSQNDNISQALQKAKQDLQKSQQQCESLENKRNILQNQAAQLDTANANLRKQLSEEQQMLRNLENDKQSLQLENRNLQQQLQERFEKEWHVYQQYLNCSSEGKSSVSRVLHGATSFEAFICNGAQAKVLGFVWDAIRDAQRRRDDESEKTMRELFHSCLKLVNYARSDDERYKLLDTSIGDDQDDVTQNYPPSSRAQGRVKEVLIHGYRNGYNNKIERKSLVVLG